MKKICFLLLVPCLLNPITKPVLASDNSIVISDEVVSTFKNSFKGNIELSTDLKFLYDSYLPPITIIDQFDDNNRINVIKYNNTTLQEIYLKKELSGYVMEEFLTISNEIEDRYLEDSNGEYIPFNINYGSPFKCFTTLSSNQVNSYFDIEETNNVYVLKANEKAYSIFSNPILNFYADYDYMLWDNSVNEYIENLIIKINKTGVPISFSFDKIKKDIYGAIKENYDVEISLIDKVDTLKPVKSNLDADVKNDFINKMNTFQNKLNEGNFAQNITFTSEALIQDISYTSYYDFDENKDSSFVDAMICSYPLEETSQGETYVCILNEGTSSNPIYTPYGISPNSKFYQSITSEPYYSLNEFIPALNKISPDFFTYNSRTKLFTFDFSNFIHGDSYFCGELLVSLYGMLDPFIQFLGFYLDNYSYNFNKLSIGFDELGYPYGTLSYNYSSFVIESSFNFSNVGEVDLVNEDSIETAVSFIRNYVI